MAATTPNSVVLAHVGSSPEVNNRYYRIVPMADRIELRYTVFVGEEPARSMRRRIDKNHDGMISATELRAYAHMIEAELDESVDGHLQEGDAAFRWEPVELGLPSPGIEDGAFQFHRVGRLCFEPDEQPGLIQQSFSFRDRLRLPSPGESELHLELGPGVRGLRSQLSGVPASFESERWLGGPGPLQHGYELDLEIDPSSAPRSPNMPCAPKQKEGQPRWLAFSAVAVAALLLVLGALALRARREN